MRSEDRAPKSSAELREARNGLLVGLGLLAAAGYIFVSGWFIPRPEGWLTAPALLPLFLSGILFIIAAIITLGTLRDGALHGLFDIDGRSASGARPLWRTLFAMAATGFFFFGLLRVLPFEIAAFFFLIAMMRMYCPEVKFWVRLAAAVVLPFILSGMFSGVFGTPMPGHGNLMQDFLYWLHHHG